MKKIVGFMDNYQEAENLVMDLTDKGFKLEDIDIVESSGRGLREEKRERSGTGFIDSLKELFGQQETEEVRGYYAEGVRRGGAVVSVFVGDEDADRAAEIMSRHGAVDIEEKAEEWKKSGWNRFDETSDPYAHEERDREKKVLPVTEEEIQIGKREVPKGKVRIYSHVSETPVEEEVRLREEHATIERRPVDRVATGAEQEAFREESFEVRETAEEPVVSKKTRVKEEVVVGKETSEHTETIRDTVRRTDVEVENEEFDRYYNSLSGKQEGDYAGYRSAYEHGGDLSRDTRYQGKSWFEVEDDVRRDWESRHPGTWDRYKDTIRHRWERRHH
jgi:uncharacterized protein (TIGR02271 family)